jgi:hypothetical protein
VKINSGFGTEGKVVNLRFGAEDCKTLVNFLEYTRQWKKERMILNFLRDISETYPEVHVKL